MWFGKLDLSLALSVAVGPAGGGCSQREEGHGAETLHHPAKGTLNMVPSCLTFKDKCTKRIENKPLSHSELFAHKSQ